MQTHTLRSKNIRRYICKPNLVNDQIANLTAAIFDECSHDSKLGACFFESSEGGLFTKKQV